MANDRKFFNSFERQSIERLAKEKLRREKAAPQNAFDNLKDYHTRELERRQKLKEEREAKLLSDPYIQAQLLAMQANDRAYQLAVIRREREIAWSKLSQVEREVLIEAMIRRVLSED